MLSRLLQVVLLGLTLLVGTNARQMTKDQLRARQKEAAQRFHDRAAPPVIPGPQLEKRSGVQNITFKNPKASGGLINLTARVSANKSSHYRVLGRWRKLPRGIF